MSLHDSLLQFQTSISRVNDYVDIAYEIDEHGKDKYSTDQKEFIVSSAFLKMFICWEEFIESAFIKYLLGEPSITGDIISSYASPKDTDHAHKLIIGTQKYVDWANHEIVKRLSNIYFENGEPISTAISSISTDISDLRVIRNAAAHISTTTQQKLDAVASRKLGVTVSNIGVAEFVTKLSPDDSTKTVLQSYQLMLEITAENIAKNST